MTDIINDLKIELNDLEIRRRSLKVIAADKTITKKVFVRNNNGHPSYYLVSDDNKEKYVHKNNMQEVKKIVQFKYDKEMYSLLGARIDGIKDFISVYNSTEPLEYFENLPEGRKKIIVPIFESEEQFIKRWEKENVQSSPFEEDNTIETKIGIKVKSKSEKIIADELFANNIKFVYEKNLDFKDYSHNVDFSIMDLKNRKTIYWEHFGLMDRPDYREKAVIKILDYIDNGLVPGENFIFTFETLDNFDVKSIYSNIDWLLKGGKWSVPRLPKLKLVA